MHVMPLESRRLFAISIVVEDQILRIFGDDTINVIELGISKDGAVIDVHTDESADPFLVNTADIRLISTSLGDGADVFIGGAIPVPMYLRGGSGPDSISGGLADDEIVAEGGFDYLFGRDGNDTLSGGLQGDLIIGSDGDDYIIGSSDLLDNDDTIAAGDGQDTLDYSGFDDIVVLQIGDLAVDPVDVSDLIYPTIEHVIGTAHDDFITNLHRNPVIINGFEGNDSITGGSGDDTLIGGAGEDTLLGMGGVDSLFANDGEADQLDGGSGADLAENDELDTILNVP